MDNDALALLVGGSDDAIALVQDWLSSHGVNADDVTLNPTRDVFSLKTHVAVVESMLSTDIRVFSHSSGKKLLRSSNGYNLPESVADVIALVSDIARLPSVRTDVKPIHPHFSTKNLRYDDSTNVGGSGTWPNDCSAAACKPGKCQGSTT